MGPLAGFAQHLRSLREAQGLSVRALADRVGVSSVTIWKWERGDSKPRPNLLVTLARALDVSPLQLNASRGTAEIADAAARFAADPLAADRNSPPELTAASSGEALADVISRAKQMIADASGTGPNNITILIEY